MLFNGNLQLLDARIRRVWESNLSTASTDINRAALLDSGNLILTNLIGRQWQSFHYPIDTWLPGPMIGSDKTKNTLQKLTSWRNLNNPASGSYSLQLDPNQNVWRRVPLSEGGLPVISKDLYSFSYNPTEHSAFEICDINANAPCECLQGYEPKVKLRWDIGDYSGGCMRKTPLQCGSNNKGFVRMQNVKLPPSSESMQVGNDQICEYICLSNCSCHAYAYNNDGECLLGNGDLNDLSRLPNNSRHVEFNIKLFEHSNNALVALAASIISEIFVSATCCYFLWRRTLKKKATKMSKLGTSSGKGLEKNSDIELKFFELHDLKAATDNFPPDNKLGEGGFVPVFKGQLLDGQKIAVKRLSNQSRQGISEAHLIAKFQHRNLVRSLGCCAEDEKKMLIYEYMPNKSLDYFIIDESRRLSVDWKKWHEIIIGIARGILYLHQDSRLRIIHRDQKASNILLDEDMNPKISDFGTARIFSGNQDEANTLRIVGIYGYMSPEYALAGLLSVKSDVFSFGVILLEVISGKKNRVSYGSDSPPNLIRQAFELIDLSIVDTCPKEVALSCIQVGLLCLQVHAVDSSTMSSVLFMLSNEATVSSPKQPSIIPNSRLWYYRNNSFDQRVDNYST
ncbi:unnamed protein product [Withania somnifera]